MAQSDARFGYQAKLGRDSHDLSRQFGFTCAPGQLLPIFEDIATPGDAYYIKHDLTYLRTLPLLAPAMIDVLVHFESFFVPLQMIFQPSENTLFSLKNLQSSNFSTASLLNTSFPEFNYSAYVNDIKQNHSTTSLRTRAFRLADMLGLNAHGFCQDFVSAGIQHWQYHPGFFPWQILTYNTIFNYYYRLDDKSQFDSNNCNWDKYYGTSSVIPTDINFMTIYQRPWDFDYFTSMYRSPIVSDVNTQRVMPTDTYQALFPEAYTVPLQKDGTGSSDNNSTVSFVNGFGSSFDFKQIDISIATASVRQMFANERLAMITGRTKKNYDSQVLAHFGVNVPHDVKHDITLIGRDTYKLNVGEVTSLASTSDAPLGELAGKGWATSPDDVSKHKFVAPCHGVVMTIFSIEPKKRYYGGFDRRNAVTDAYDIPTPEFDRLGNVPMFRYETGTGLSTHSSGDAPDALYADDIIGWKERYYCNKRNIDRTSIAFEVPSYNNANIYSSYFLSYRPFEDYVGGNGVRPDLENRFYISTSALDTLFGVHFSEHWRPYDADQPTAEDWDNLPHLAYSRDPFIVDAYPKVTKVSWMSKDGEPIYPY